MPNEFGEYDQTPDAMGAEVESYLKDAVVNILGGCCGTTPDHIKVMADIAAKYEPRKVAETV